MNQQISHQTKTSQTQQFIASQLSKLPDKTKLQQLIPVQLHINCFERKHNEGTDTVERILFSFIYQMKQQQQIIATIIIKLLYQAIIETSIIIQSYIQYVTLKQKQFTY